MPSEAGDDGALGEGEASQPAEIKQAVHEDETEGEQAKRSKEDQSNDGQSKDGRSQSRENNSYSKERPSRDVPTSENGTEPQGTSNDKARVPSRGTEPFERWERDEMEKLLGQLCGHLG